MTITSISAYSRIGAAAPVVRRQVDVVTEAPAPRPTLVQHEIDVISPTGAKTRHPGIEVWC